MSSLYLDYSATAPVREEVLRAIWPVHTETFANPASVHTPGQQARERLDWARASVAQTLGCASEQVIFTSGGTESDNLAIVGAARANPRGKHVVVSAVEHPAVLESAAHLERVHGFRVSVVPVDAQGTVLLDELDRVLTPDTTLCSVMLANNEVGTLQPVTTIAAMCAERGVPFHTDAVQAGGWVELAPTLRQAQALSLSGHKLGATKGVGVLVRDLTLELEPTVFGGGQQGGLRSGTEDVAGPVGFAVALALAEHERAQAQGLGPNRAEDLSQQSTPTPVADPVAVRRDAFIDSVLERVPDAQLTGHATERLPGHASFVFPRVNGEALLVDLDHRGIACSSGSACAAGSQDPSPVLLAMGIDSAIAHTSVRFSFSRGTSADELAQAADALVQAHASLVG